MVLCWSIVRPDCIVASQITPSAVRHSPVSRHYPSIDLPSVKQVLWEDARRDFLSIAPEFATSDLLPCPACARLLPQRHFTLEHILPQQALANDPPEVRNDPQLSTNRRTRLLLLCSYGLKTGENTKAPNGCNGWKGRYFDSHIRDIIVDSVPTKRGGAITPQHSVALSAAAYLALVSEFGYRVVYTASGWLLRQQFFHPRRHIEGFPDNCQMILTGGRFTYPNIPSEVWAKPFNFVIYEDRCLVTIRQTAMYVPLSRDPRLPVSSFLRFVPSKYRLRPDFRSFLG